MPETIELLDGGYCQQGSIALRAAIEHRYPTVFSVLELVALTYTEEEPYMFDLTLPSECVSLSSPVSKRGKFPSGERALRRLNMSA